MTDQHLSQIQQKLALLRGYDRKLVVFGANLHKYRLQPIADEYTVRAFEQRYDIKLPQEYRSFIQSVGNGGAGPDYGIFSLDEAAVELDDDTDNSPWASALAEPFCPPRTLEEAEALAFPAPGTLPICHQGCGAMVVLVISGLERGHVWYWADTWVPCPPAGSRPGSRSNAKASTESYDYLGEWQQWASRLLSKDNTYRIHFLDWYAEWLDEKLTAYKKRTYPFGPIRR